MTTNNNNNDDGKWEQIPMAQEIPQQYQQQQYQQQAPVAMQYAQPTQQVVYQQQQQPQMYMAYGAPMSPGGLQRGDQGFYSTQPRRIQCQFCQYEVVTGIAREPGCGTHLIALGLCVVGCWPFCLIPYCVDDCSDTVHICANCHRVVGRKNIV